MLLFTAISAAPISFFSIRENGIYFASFSITVKLPPQPGEIDTVYQLAWFFFARSR
jgi:hypothetical protein